MATVIENYWNKKISTLTRLNANSMERCMKNPKDAIIIFALTVN